MYETMQDRRKHFDKLQFFSIIFAVFLYFASSLSILEVANNMT